MLSVESRPIDHARAARLALAWSTGDEDALHATMDEITADSYPAATPAAIFACVDLAARIAVAAAPDTFADIFRNAILEFVVAKDQQDQG